jgi:hypothetical protein
MDPLTALAAFNASYAVVKTAAQNAGEITDIFANIGKMLSAKKAIEQAAKNDPEKSDLELYAAKVQLDQKWDEVKQILIWTGNWPAYEKFVKDRREAERQTKIKMLREHQAKMKKIKEGFMIAAVIVSVLSAIGIFFWIIWLMKNRGGI